MLKIKRLAVVLAAVFALGGAAALPATAASASTARPAHHGWYCGGYWYGYNNPCYYGGSWYHSWDHPWYGHGWGHGDWGHGDWH